MIQPQPEGARGAAQESRSADSADLYTVRLERFEGPLDLLLYLIQRDEMDVYDIPISRITRQYLEYIELIDVFNLDNAGEFLVMAATLMRIKARMLLPVQKLDDGDGEELDPRDELVRRLLEYRKFKEAAASLAEKEESRRDFYARGADYPFLDLEQEAPEFSLTLFDLLGAVRNVLRRIESDPSHHVYQEVFTVESQTRRLIERLAGVEQLRF
ncbi:MAG TPA: segregation/condensation protein A, partial [Candidatus Krumholzibacteria bacterium]